jgi:hypothetical protein
MPGHGNKMINVTKVSIAILCIGALAALGWSLIGRPSGETPPPTSEAVDKGTGATLPQNACELGDVSACLATGRFGRAAHLHVKDASLARNLELATTALQKTDALASYMLAVYQRRFASGSARAEDVYHWSRRLLRNQRMLSSDGALQALQAHAETMRSLEHITLRPNPFSPKSPAAAPLDVTFFKAEAECLVEQERKIPLDTTFCKRHILSAASDNYSAFSNEYIKGLKSRSFAQYSPYDWMIEHPEMACRWSVRWMQSECYMDAGRRDSALKAHIARLEELEEQTLEAFQSGNAPASYLMAIEYRLCEARCPRMSDTSECETAANRLYELGQHLVDIGNGTNEDAYIFSLQILKAANMKFDALKAHAARMSTLKDKTLLRVSAGIASIDQGFEAAYFAEEATAWLDHPPDIAVLE